MREKDVSKILKFPPLEKGKYGKIMPFQSDFEATCSCHIMISLIPSCQWPLHFSPPQRSSPPAVDRCDPGVLRIRFVNCTPSVTATAVHPLPGDSPNVS